MTEKNLGSMAHFLLPSLKLKQLHLQSQVKEYLLQEFDGFTVAEGMISGYWKNREGEATYGEHQEYKVAVKNKEKKLKTYLSHLAKKLDEECIYLEIGSKAYFIYASGARAL